MAVEKYTTSKDGVELQFAANHLGHFLFTNLLMDEIIAGGPGSRILNVSSFGYMSGGVRFEDPNFNDGADYNPWLSYSQSKSANILFSYALADKRKERGVLSFALNPGFVPTSKLMTNVTNDMFADGKRVAQEALGGEEMPEGILSLKTLAQSSSTSLYSALAPELQNHSGSFLTDNAIWTGPLRAHVVGAEKQEKLWKLSEKLVGQDFE